MSEKKPVVVYGVSGYTGRLVCEYLREYNIPFIAAGRDAAKVKAVVEKIPGIETADYEVAEVEHTVEALNLRELADESLEHEEPPEREAGHGIVRPGACSGRSVARRQDVRRCSASADGLTA